MSARILVVDDVPANVKLLEARLSAEYFDVLTASNGSEALEICARAECDIILLDVMMPDIDGFEVCRRLKANPATHFIPVVIVTALDSPADRVRGLQAGADDFLTKPVSDVVLIARVRSLTRLKMMTDELRMRAITSLEIGMQALNELDNNFWVAVKPSLGVTLLGAAGAILAGRWGSRWIGWTALILGVALIIPFVDFFALVLSFLWVIIVSILLYRDRNTLPLATEAGSV